jgi:cyclase
VVFSKGGRVQTNLDAVDWARFGEDSGAGELVVNSIDTDGVKGGFDLEMLQKIVDVVNIPVVASGGAGSVAHFIQLFKNVDVDAGLGASVFHFGEIQIKDLKKDLKKSGIEVRL